MKQRTFIDSTKVFAKAGNGGNGCVSFRREKFIPMGGPDGGDGGKGGSVIIIGDHDEDSLIRVYYTPHQNAQEGGRGMGQRMSGKSGKDCIIKVPCGTEVWNAESGEMLGDITKHGAELVAAKGGKGGLGNCHWKSSTHQAPLEHTEGGRGEVLTLRLELKLIADVGLVGFPNAGKSSLLSHISDAHPKVAAYPFTTLNPIIGTMVFDDYLRIKVADIPGLIDGAHNGTGLGYDFLRHIERSRCLIYVIDMAGVDARSPLDDYKTLKNELELYNKVLAKRPSIIVANKMDLPEAKEYLKKFVKKFKTRPIPVSALAGQGIDTLRKAIIKLVTKKPSAKRPKK